MTKVGPRDSLVRPLVYRRSGKLSISLRHLCGLADLVRGSYYSRQQSRFGSYASLHGYNEQCYIEPD